jgi:ubiquinone/menaquinone biosynthesis C-methylase UbiE
MDPIRARDALSRGDTSKRRFIEVPTGHLLKTSREALETFQLVATEVGQMALGREIRAVLPDLGTLDRRRRAERSRLGPESPDLHAFWRNYVVGPTGRLGIELMSQISAYRELMGHQIAALDLEVGQKVADLGCGTGAFPLQLVASAMPRDIRVFGLDFVREGMQRARELIGIVAPGESAVAFIEANLEVRRRQPAIPLASGSCDAVLASLFLSYVEDASATLREMRRILKPGGRLVVSTLRRDADVSRIFLNGLEELRAGVELLPVSANPDEVDYAARDYLNQASKLLDLEESGTFRFWDAGELDALVRKAGFRTSRIDRAFGDPPQAVVVTAIRR